MQSILIVDDMQSIYEMLDTIIQPLGYTTEFAKDGGAAIELYREKRHDIVLCDIRMQPIDGLEFLRQIKKLEPEVIVIMMSGFANVDNAMASLKHGAFDYLTKPFKVDQLITAIQRAADTHSARNGAFVASEDETASIFGQSDAVKQLNAAIAKAADTLSPILIQGEPGTQRKTVAQLLHAKLTGQTAEAPFVEVDLKALSAQQAEETLFGLEEGKGAATEAAGGTLFLRNLHAADRGLQSKIGEMVKEQKDEMRLICSVCHEIEALVEKGDFDDSLFYRISTTSLKTPPLRDRADDILVLVRRILDSLDKGGVELSERAAALLQSYLWPGNLTELEEAIKAAANHCADGTLRADDLPQRVRDLQSWPNLEAYLEDQSRKYMQRVLKACRGDVAQASDILQCETVRLEAL